MYKAAVRWMIRRSIQRSTQGDYGPALAVFADDANLTFPGANSWSRQHREPAAGPRRVPTHRGKAEIETFLQRYVEHGIQMEVEDILVNGPPWNTRLAVRVHDWIPGGDGGDIYANRAVLMARLSWGRSTTRRTTRTASAVAAYDRSAHG